MKGSLYLGVRAAGLYMEVGKAVSRVDEALGYVCLGWATEDRVRRMLNIGNSLSSSEVEAAEWFVTFN